MNTNAIPGILRELHFDEVYTLEINVNNLTQATTTYSVSFNWHGIPCAFLYL